jgi:hypothetical protein
MIAMPAKADVWEDNCRVSELVSRAQLLDEMKPIRRVPESGELPFGPSHARISLLIGPTVVGKSEVGFRLYVPRRHSPSARRESEGLRVTSTLALVRRSGAVAKVIWTKEQSLKGLGTSQRRSVLLRFVVSRKPALYRVQSTFTRFGRQVGQFAEYLRVVRARTRVRMRVVKSPLSPGADLFARLENIGTLPVTYGFDYGLDVFDGTQWQEHPSPPDRFFGVGFSMAGRSVHTCKQLVLPLDLAPGHYRLRKGVTTIGGRDIELSDDFFVVSPGQ